MITESVLFVFLYIIFGLIRVVLSPIDLLLSTTFPDLSAQLSSVSTYFSTISGTLAYAYSWTLLPASILVAVIGYWTFVYGSYVAVYLFKKIPKWIHYLKIW